MIKRKISYQGVKKLSFISFRVARQGKKILYLKFPYLNIILNEKTDKKKTNFNGWLQGHTYNFFFHFHQHQSFDNMIQRYQITLYQKTLSHLPEKDNGVFILVEELAYHALWDLSLWMLLQWFSVVPVCQKIHLWKD